MQHNYVILLAMPRAISQTHSASYLHRNLHASPTPKYYSYPMESDLSERSTHPTFERQEPVWLKLRKFHHYKFKRGPLPPEIIKQVKKATTL